MYRHRFVLGLVLTAVAVPAQSAAPDDWVIPMKAVHTKFKGRPGTLALFGDSITWAPGFWTPLGDKEPKNPSPEMAEALKTVRAYMREQCWHWKGKAYGNMPSMGVDWLLQNADEWFQKHNPEVAVLMIGTNDSPNPKLAEPRLRKFIQKCLDNGTIPIVNTIPPLHNSDDPKKVKEVGDARAEMVRRVARDMKVPLIDFYGEVLRRRPDDWDGKALIQKVRQELGTQKVPADKLPQTLIGTDGAHLSVPSKYHLDFSEEALNNHGTNLRTYLTVLRYAEVIRKVLPPRKKTPEEIAEDKAFIDAKLAKKKPK